MIQDMILHNFQAHAHSEIHFSKGINSIVGESDNGKTSIMRAFQWVWKNKPLGSDYVSHWATKQDSKGNPVVTDTCYVTIIFYEGKYVTREKNADGFNGYRIGVCENGELIESESFAAGRNVPFKVLDMFNMEDVNIQTQHDSMFLLSDSGQDVARYFNKLIKLDIADTALSLAKSEKRKAKSEVTEIETEINELNESLSKLSWVDAAEMQVEKIELTDGKLDKLTDDIFSLEQMIYNIQEVEDLCVLPEYYEAAEMAIAKVDLISERMSSLDNKIYDIAVLESDLLELHRSIRDAAWLDKAKPIVENIGNISKTISDIRDKLFSLDDTIEEIHKCEAGITSSDYMGDALEIIDDIDLCDKKTFRILDQIDSIDIMINKMENCEMGIVKGEKKLNSYKSQLPEVCPTCGQKLQESI